MLENRAPGALRDAGPKDHDAQAADNCRADAAQHPAESGRARLPREAFGASGSPSFLEILDGLFDDVAIDAMALVGISDEQAMIADDVDEPRDPAGIGFDALGRRFGEQLEIRRARLPQAALDVFTHLVMGQRTDGGLHTDPLPELAKLGQLELQLELRLTHEQDLQQLLGRRLEIREQPNLLEGLRSQVLGFVENQDRLLTFAVALDQEAVERRQSLGHRAAAVTDPEILQRVFED